MTNSEIMVRKEHLRNLPSLAVRLMALRPGTATGEAAVLEMLKGAVEAECEGCGIRVAGDDLARLAKPAGEASESPKVARLRLGYCGRSGCDAYYYRIQFRPVPSVDWGKVLDEGETEGEPAEAVVVPPEQASDRMRAAAMASVRRWAPRAAIAVVMIGGLLLVRHWRRGGTVPWIREPEKFQVEVPVPGPGSDR